MKRWSSVLAALTVFAAAAVAVGALYRVVRSEKRVVSSDRTASAHTFRAGPACMKLPATPYLGVAVLPPISRHAQSFATTTRTRLSVIEFYNPFGSPFQFREAQQAASLGALPIVQLNPRTTPLAAIAAGRYDGYLRRYASAVKAFGCRVVLSFGHEMNGAWYPWGCHHTSAAVFVAAWRRVVSVITRSGARNVTWMWTTSPKAPGNCPLPSRYPGNQYVNWVGLDGYLRKPGDTFARILGRSLALIHRFSDKPILLSETGVVVGLPGAPARIHDLYQGAAQARGVFGVVYFDAATGKFGDYRPQDHAATLAAFRQAAARYTSAR